MSRRLRGLPIGKLVTITIGLVIALGIRPVSVREILAAYVLALAAIVLVTLARLARTEEEWERSTSELAQALAPRRHARLRPAELVSTERDLTLGMETLGHFHARIRPLLWSIVLARTESPRKQLDNGTWELLRPDQPPADDMFGPGIPRERLVEVLDEIERL